MKIKNQLHPFTAEQEFGLNVQVLNWHLGISSQLFSLANRANNRLFDSLKRDNKNKLAKIVCFEAGALRRTA